MRRLTVVCALFVLTVASAAYGATVTFTRLISRGHGVSYATTHGHTSGPGPKHKRRRRHGTRRAGTLTVVGGGSVLMGDQSIESTLDSNPSGVAGAAPFKADVAGTISSIGVYVDGRNKATSLAVALYSDRGGLPGSRLTSSSLSAPRSGAWNAVTVPSVSISSGKAYWLAILGTGGTLYFRDRVGGTCSGDNSSQSGLTSLPASWTPGARQSRCPLSAYVRGTRAASTAPLAGTASPTSGAGGGETTAGNASAPANSTTPGTTSSGAPADGGLPVISGTAVVGYTLTTSSGSWGGSPLTYTYQWQDCDGGGNNCADILGAITASYAVATADVGHTIRSVVTAVNLEGTASATSLPTAVVLATLPALPSNTTAPRISGTPQQGQTLSVSNGSWSNSPTSYTYQWEDCNVSGTSCSGISGATSSSYTLTSGDVGQTIRATVIASNVGGSGSATSAATGTVAPLPAPAAAFVFSPSAPVTGQSVHFDGSGSSCAAGPCSYSWADDPPSGGSWALGSGQSMDFTFSGVGTKYVTLTVTDAQNRTATVEHDVVVGTAGTAAPGNTSVPMVSGSAQQGQTLTASTGSWSGSPTSYGYQWRDCDGSGANCANIGGATSSSYVLGSGDVGHTVRVVVTATNAGGSTPATSAQTGVVSAVSGSVPANTSVPTVSGSAQQGQTLTASTGSWSGSPTSYGYQWQDCDSSGANCANIGGATSSTYTLASGDVGDTVDVVVTATNSAGSASAASAVTGVVGGASQTCSRTFTPSSVGSSPYPGSAVNSAVQGASGGQTLCFAAGSYGEIDIYAAHPASRVTLEPVAGAAATGVYFNLNGVSNLTITGFLGSASSAGLLVQTAGQGNNSNITFSYNSMSSNGVSINDNGVANANIDIAHNSFVGFASSGESSRVNVVSDNACPNGITIEYNRMSGGESDGIDVSGNSCQTQIVHNEIDSILEPNCHGIHCDAFQDNGGGNGTVLAYNYIYNVSDCFLLDDGSSNYNIHDNVCQTNSADSSYWMQFGGAQTITLNHNTVLSTNGAQYGNDHNGNPSSNVTFINNIFYSDPVQNSGQPVAGSFNESYNLCPSGCIGSNEIKATPTFTGGNTPTTWPGFSLAANSPGTTNSSEHLNRGVTTFNATPGP